MQLKKPDKETGEYDLGVCSVSKCNNQSEVIYDTKKLAQVRYAFCEKHHKVWCEETEETQGRSVLHDRGGAKVLPLGHQQEGKDGQD